MGMLMTLALERLPRTARAAVAILFGCAALGFSQSAWATSISVSAANTADIAGTCTGNSSIQSCTSLRAAIQFANTNNANDTIALGSATYVLGGAVNDDQNVSGGRHVREAC